MRVNIIMNHICIFSLLLMLGDSINQTIHYEERRKETKEACVEVRCDNSLCLNQCISPIFIHNVHWKTRSRDMQQTNRVFMTMMNR